MALRIVVAGGRQPFVFPCPHCSAPLRATLFARIEPMELRTESEDFELLEDEAPDSVTVAVATDVPVHLGLVGATGRDGLISPFILVSQEVGLQETSKLMDKVNALRALREHLFPAVRRAAAFWSDRDLGGLTQALRAVPGSEQLDFENETPMDLFDEVVSLLFRPLGQADLREACAEELLTLIKVGLDEHLISLTALFDEFDSGPLEEHRQRVVGAIFTALDEVDAFFPALWAEEMEGRVDLAPYRVMRDDFATRKSSYQDLFELASRTLAYTAPIANLALRGDSKAFSDGISRTPSKARRARAFERTS